MSQGNATLPKAAASATAGQGGTKPLGAHHIDSARLFRGARELVITHNGERYSLRVTRNEKLILTK